MHAKFICDAPQISLTLDLYFFEKKLGTDILYWVVQELSLILGQAHSAHLRLASRSVTFKFSARSGPAE